MYNNWENSFILEGLFSKLIIHTIQIDHYHVPISQSIFFNAFISSPLLTAFYRV